MFWKSSPKFQLPETANSLNYRIGFLQHILKDSFFTNINVFSFEHDFPSELTKDDAVAIFGEIKTHMGLNEVNLHLDFFWEKPLEVQNNSGFIDTKELYKIERLNIGQYIHNDEGFSIKLGMTTLEDTKRLVFVIAHELAHYILLGQHQLFFNDEKLTDMLAIAYGFGGHWLHSQNWKDYKSGELTSYLNQKEGLFVIAKFIEMNTHTLVWENLPKNSIPLLKQAVDSVVGKTEKENPYVAKFIKVSFLQNAIHLKVSKDHGDNSLRNSLVTISTYNNWVKKGRAKTLKTKRPDTEKIISDFLQQQTKWIVTEREFLENTVPLLQCLLDSPSYESLVELIENWRNQLSFCETEMNRHILNYEKHSYVVSEKIVSLYVDYRDKKARYIHNYLKTILDASEYNVTLDS